MLAKFVSCEELGTGTGSIVEIDFVILITAKRLQPDSFARRNFPQHVIKQRVFHVRESY